MTGERHSSVYLVFPHTWSNCSGFLYALAITQRLPNQGKSAGLGQCLCHVPEFNTECSEQLRTLSSLVHQHNRELCSLVQTSNIIKHQFLQSIKFRLQLLLPLAWAAGSTVTATLGATWAIPWNRFTTLSANQAHASYVQTSFGARK